MIDFLIQSRNWLVSAFATVVAIAGPASANPLAGNLTVDFQNGQGTLSGYFQTDGSAAVTSWNLQTSRYDCNPCTLSTGFPGIDYTPSNSTASVGFFFGTQSISFQTADFQLDFLINCGGNGADCISNAALGSNLTVTGQEMANIDFLPFRALTPALLEVTDPPVGFSFNFIPASTAVPEPGTLGIIVVGLVGLAASRKRAI